MEIKEVKKRSNQYLKYSGLAFQLAAVVLIGILGGKKLDAVLGNEKPWMTMLLTIFLFSGYMYKLYVELTKKAE